MFVHAGFTNLNGIEHEYYPNMVFWDRTLWETALSLNPILNHSDSFYPKRFNLYHEIFIGHTPTLYLGIKEPVNKANVWNLDTGAGFKGSLTIMDVHSKEFW